MEGNGSLIQAIGNRVRIGWFSFTGNDTSDPSLSTLTGPSSQWVDSITRSANKLTIVFRRGFFFQEKPRFTGETVDSATLSEHRVTRTESYTESTRTLVLLVSDLTGTARDVPTTVKMVVYIHAREGNV